MRRLPSHVLFQRIDARMRETGHVEPTRRGAGRPRSVRRVAFVDRVLQLFEETPSTSTRSIGRKLNTSHVNVWNVLHEMGLHPYHLKSVQHLTADDFLRRVNFCQWFQQQTVATPDFPAIVLYTDEASFTREGIFHTHNSHVWDFENLHAQFVGRYQHLSSVNVWARIVRNHLVGLYLLPNTLRGSNYLVFVRDVLPQLLENIPLNIRERIWLQDDGAHPHFDRRVRNNLHATFPNRWIGMSGWYRGHLDHRT